MTTRFKLLGPFQVKISHGHRDGSEPELGCSAAAESLARGRAAALGLAAGETPL